MGALLLTLLAATLGAALAVSCGPGGEVQKPTRVLMEPGPLRCAKLCNHRDFWIPDSQLSEGKILDLVKERLEAGENPSIIEGGISPLHGALMWAPRDDVVNLLLDWGADIHAVSSIHERGTGTPLHLAATISGGLGHVGNGAGAT